jgi:transposase
MIKVHMKISGCFKSLEHAKGFCRMRGYIVSYGKNGISAAEAVDMALNDQIPDFIRKALTESQVYGEAA